MNWRGFCAILGCERSTTCPKTWSSTTSIFLRRSSELVILNPLIIAPIRDVNDIIVIQTAIIGDADSLCTKDDDFFEKPASDYLRTMGVAVLDDIGLMHRLRS
jgi:predicted nucleic acid-binding protein